MIVSSANIDFGAEGEFYNIVDAGWIENVMIDACKAQGRSVPRYIKPKQGTGFSDA
jgi:2,4'-dihydroxyacetophenone dioxygenase